MKHSFVWPGALLLLACGGSTLDVGSSKGGSSAAEGNTDSGGSSATGGKTPGGVAGGFAAGGSLVNGGATMAFGGQVAMGAHSGGGETNGAGGATMAFGGQASMPPGGNVSVAGAAMIASGGKAGEAGAPPNLLVPQVCSAKFSQVWEGDTLDFFFNPQNDKWRLVLDGTDENGRVCGTATYLAAGQAAPPPPTDPDETYPPSYKPDFNGGDRSPWPGVTYSIIQGAEVDAALHFRIATSELWKDWCALQAPVPQRDGYGCVAGDNGWSGDEVTCTVTNRDGSTQQYPLAKCVLCSGGIACTCNAEYCAAADTGDVVFDLKVDGTQLTGTVGGTMIRFELVN